MSGNYQEIFDNLKVECENVIGGCTTDPDGNILFVAGEWDPQEDAKAILDTWLQHGPRISVQGTGFSVLRSEPEALVAKNVTGKGSVLGSITRGGNYFFAICKPTDAEQMGRDLFDVARAADKMDV